MNTKKFDRNLYNKADPLSNGVMVRWLEKEGYENIDPQETYGVDITCQKEDTPAFFETEIKYGWTTDWPDHWNEIRIPYRKHKIIDKWVHAGSEGTLTFVIFRPDCKQAWFIDGQAVRDSRIDTMNTKYSRDEKFYHIDVDDANLINMENIDAMETFINRKHPT